MTETCETCRFHHIRLDDHECRRRAPSATEGFPKVRPDCGCGDYEPEPKQPNFIDLPKTGSAVNPQQTYIPPLDFLILHDVATMILMFQTGRMELSESEIADFGRLYGEYIRTITDILAGCIDRVYAGPITTAGMFLALLNGASKDGVTRYFAVLTDKSDKPIGDRNAATSMREWLSRHLKNIDCFDRFRDAVIRMTWAIHNFIIGHETAKTRGVGGFYYPIPKPPVKPKFGDPKVKLPAGYSHDHSLTRHTQQL